MFNEISKFKLIENDEFDSISIFIIQNEKDKKEWDRFKSLDEELKMKPFDFKRKLVIKKYRGMLSDRILNFSRRNIEDNLDLLDMFIKNTVFGISSLNLLEESYIGINYDYQTGLNIIKNESAII